MGVPLCTLIHRAVYDYEIKAMRSNRHQWPWDSSHFKDCFVFLFSHSSLTLSIKEATECIYGFCLFLRVNGDYFPKPL